MLTWKFITLYNYVRKEERSKTKYLISYLKRLEIEDKIKNKTKLREEINKDFKPFIYCWQECKAVQPLWKTMAVSEKLLKIYLF